MPPSPRRRSIRKSPAKSWPRSSVSAIFLSPSFGRPPRRAVHLRHGPGDDAPRLLELRLKAPVRLEPLRERGLPLLHRLVRGLELARQALHLVGERVHLGLEVLPLRRPGRLLGREPLRERRLGERDLVLVRLAERRDLLRVLGLERVGRADM